MGIFDRREQFKPYEYPVAIDLMDLLQKTYWLHTEVPFSADPQEIKNLPPHEYEVVVRSLLAISTVEVSVKTFWTQLGNHFPKSEWEMLGVVAGESEARHARSYAHLLSLLDLEDRFSIVKEVDCIKGRFAYLDKYLKLSPGNADKRKYIIKLILFSVLIEHTSLFSQFATILYFYRHKGLIKDVRNIIKWTAIEEELHFRIGATIIGILRQEYPEMFDEELNSLVKSACLKSVRYEADILDWIFENGELDRLSKQNLLDFMKDKVNSSMKDMGFDQVFDPEKLDLTSTKFFNEDVFADSMDDFFAVRVTDYTLKDKPITSEDLF